MDNDFTLAGQINQRNNALMLSVIIGAGLGYAVARDRGGSALAGVAAGAFIGAVAVTAAKYASLLLDQNNGSLPRSFESLGDNAQAERRIFVSENIPVIRNRLEIASIVERGNSSAGLGQILDRLEQLENWEQKQTIPTPAYEMSAPVYSQCVTLLPKQAGMPIMPSDAREPESFAREESKKHQSVVDEGARANRLAIQILARNGISL